MEEYGHITLGPLKNPGVGKYNINRDLGNIHFTVAPKTKDFLSFLKSFDSSNKKILLVIPDNNTNVFLSSRNLANSNVITASELNTYAVLDAEKLFIVEESLGTIENILSNN